MVGGRESPAPNRGQTSMKATLRGIANQVAGDEPAHELYLLRTDPCPCRSGAVVVDECGSHKVAVVGMLVGLAMVIARFTAVLSGANVKVGV